MYYDDMEMINPELIKAEDRRSFHPELGYPVPFGAIQVRAYELSEADGCRLSQDDYFAAAKKQMEDQFAPVRPTGYVPP